MGRPRHPTVIGNDADQSYLRVAIQGTGHASDRVRDFVPDPQREDDIGDTHRFSKSPAEEPTSDRTLMSISATIATHFTHSTRIVGFLPVLQKNLPRRNWASGGVTSVTAPPGQFVNSPTRRSVDVAYRSTRMKSKGADSRVARLSIWSSIGGAASSPTPQGCPMETGITRQFRS